MTDIRVTVEGGLVLVYAESEGAEEWLAVLVLWVLILSFVSAIA